MGMGVHESQSLFFEMQLGRSKEFVAGIAPHLVSFSAKTRVLRQVTFTGSTLKSSLGSFA